MPAEDEHTHPEQPPGETQGPQPPASRDLILLTPFRLPAQNALYLGNEDVACFLNGYVALWHPALVLLASSPPRIASPYDYEQPVSGHVYAVPESPPMVLPDDWDEQVLTEGAVAFRAAEARLATLGNLKESVRDHLSRHGAEADTASLGLLDIPPELAAPFFGIGFGYAHVEALLEAMDHQNVIDTEELWEAVRQAARALADGRDVDACRQHLKSAAELLLSAREVVYSVEVYLLDICLLTQKNLEQPLPAGSRGGVTPPLLPLNLVAPASILEQLAAVQPERIAALREHVAAETVEVCGGSYVEREDALLPVESQLWNLLHGLAVTEELLGKPVHVYARQRFAGHPQVPSLLQAAGLSRALLLAFDESVLPAHRATVVNWPATDGKQIDAFCRAPHAADNPQTFFHVAHYLHETIMQDQSATLALLHTTAPVPFYEDWLELSRLAPVLGQWTTFSRYFDEVTAGDYTPPAPADDFHTDYLGERTSKPEGEETEPSYYGQEPKARVYESTEESRRHPVSAFAAHARARRRLDTAWTLAALHRGLAGKSDTLNLDDRLREVEDRIEAQAPASIKGTDLDQSLAEVTQQAAEALAQRLLSRATGEQPGYLLLNPCSYPRRVVLELEGITAPLPVSGSVKACQVDAQRGVAHVVAEVPALGFAWLPRSGAGGSSSSKMRLADDRCVRNEFFEAEVDPATGGLRGIRDHRTRISRIGQQLVYNPGNVIRIKQIKTTSTGPAYGEIVSEGALLSEHEEVLATFRQRFRAWLGRPVLDMRIEIFPEHRPRGYPWHAYYGARFAWRDERALVLRGVNGLGYVTHQTRPESPDYLEVREGGQGTVILTGGLPFHQRHGSRMADVILIPEGETAQGFDLAIGLDRDHPMLTAAGMVTPVPIVLTTKGPPHIGASGWLFHLDTPNLLLTSLRPAPDGADGVVARLVECGNRSGHAEFRCARDPVIAHHVNARGEVQMEASYTGDTVLLDVAEGEWVHLRIDFSRDAGQEEFAANTEEEIDYTD